MTYQNMDTNKVQLGKTMSSTEVTYRSVGERLPSASGQSQEFPEPILNYLLSSLRSFSGR